MMRAQQDTRQYDSHKCRPVSLVASDLEAGQVRGTAHLVVADGSTAAGSIVAAFSADFTAVVVDEGQVGHGVGQQHSNILTVAVVDRVGSIDNTSLHGVDRRVQGPGTRHNVVSTVWCRQRSSNLNSGAEVLA